MTGLTERQKAVLLEIIDSVVDRGYPPTLRELADAMELKTSNGVRVHLHALQRKGYVKLTGGSMSRGIEPSHPEVRAAICIGMLNKLTEALPEIGLHVEALEQSFLATFT